MAVPSRVSLLNSILRLNLVFGYGIPPEFRGGVHLFSLTTINKSPGQSELWERLFAVHGLSERTTVQTSSLLLRLFFGSRNCVPMALTDKSPPAQGQ